MAPDDLDSIPILQCSLGSTVLRRKLASAGCKTLADALSLSDNELDAILDPHEADEVIRARDNAKKGRGMSCAKRSRPTPITKTPEHEPTRATQDDLLRQPKGRVATFHWPKGELEPRPTSSEYDRLLSFDTKARLAFSDLADMLPVVMAYQAFDYFDTDLDALSAGFSWLFARFRNNPRRAMSLIDQDLRHAFVVYVSLEARDLFDGSSLWEPLFNLLAIKDGNAQTLFKNLYVDQLSKQGMPRYQRGEKTNFYYYTALLHGGLSKSSWADLWQKVLLPHAKKRMKQGVSHPEPDDARRLLFDLEHSTGRGYLNESTLNILEKTPERAIVPLLNEALLVAFQFELIELNKRSVYGSPLTDSVVLPTGYLPVMAMRGLQKALDQVEQPSLHHERGKAKHALLFLPKAEMTLNPGEGTISLTWGQQSLPDAYRDCVAQFCVSGKVMKETPIQPSPRGCRLPETSLEIAPRSRFVVSVRLVKNAGNTNDQTILAQLKQIIDRDKPGVLEFILNRQGTYRHRRPRERFSTTKRVAYLIEDKYEIEPSAGMNPIEQYGAVREAGPRILVFDVEPGACGSIIDKESGEAIASWSESYFCSIEKDQLIGQTSQGVDLFPCSSGHSPVNISLPTVTVESPSGKLDYTSLRAALTIDDEMASVSRKIITSQEDESSASMVKFALCDSLVPATHASDCRLTITQAGVAQPIFRYRFAIVPIARFHITSLSFEHGIVTALYEFSVPHRTVVSEENREDIVEAWSTYQHKSLLKDEELPLTIYSPASGKATDVRLGLAGIEIGVPGQLWKTARQRELDLLDLLELGRGSSAITVTARGWRQNRGLFLHINNAPLFYDELKAPGTFRVDLLANKDLFLDTDTHQELSLALGMTVRYGYDDSRGQERAGLADGTLLPFRSGLGVGTAKISLGENGHRLLRFESPSRQKLSASFFFRGQRLGEGFDIPPGTQVVPLPRLASNHIGSGRDVYLVLTPLSPFGKPLENLQETLPIER